MVSSDGKPLTDPFEDYWCSAGSNGAGSNSRSSNGSSNGSNDGHTSKDGASGAMGGYRPASLLAFSDVVSEAVRESTVAILGEWWTGEVVE